MTIVNEQLRVITANMLECLCDIVAMLPVPPEVCRFETQFEVPEELFPEDICCRGLAYLATGDTWASSDSFPEEDIVRQITGNCPPPAWAVEFRMGIMRCVPTDLNPSTTALQDAFFQDLDDLAALHKAACCVRFYIKNDPQWMGYDVIIGRQGKTVQGGCRDRYQPLTIQVPNCDCGA